MVEKVGTVTEVSREELKKWIDSSVRKTKPFAEYKSVKSEIGVGFARTIHNQVKIMCIIQKKLCTRT